MKKSILLIVAVCLFGIWGCSTDDQNFKETQTKEIARKSTGGATTPDIVHNQIVVKFDDPSLTDIQKDAIRTTIQNNYNFAILTKEVCSCDPNGPELWTIDVSLPGFIDVENLVENLSDDTEGEQGLEGDLQFFFSLDNSAIQGNYSSSIQGKIDYGNSADMLNIAILDSGLDYNFFSTPILYNTSDRDSKYNDVSGWDFINEDPDIQDDYGHGTLVAKLIHDELSATNIYHKILAIKAFDHRGRGDYFSIVCGTNYISKIPDIHLINMSFGWYDNTEQNILKNIIASIPNHPIIITSAGNDGINGNIEENKHYPSGYALTNMFAVGGYELSFPIDHTISLTDYFDDLWIERSNYGSEVVDLLAPFNGYELYLNTRQNPDPILIEPVGTSFSAAFTTARIGKLFDPRSSILSLKSEFLRSTYPLLRMDDIVKDGTVLIPYHFNN